MTEIKNFKTFVEPMLKADQKLVSYELENLLPPGENYGSVMIQIRIKILNKSDDEEIIHCVGKTCPPSEFLWDIFNTKITFKKEIAVYDIIVPTLNNFGKEKGIENLFGFFAKSFGARISLDPKSNVVDKDAALVLENLKVQGYELCERYVGFDMNCTKFILDDLATMHAGIIAYRIEKPEEFKTKIRPYLNRDYVLNLKDDEIDKYVRSIQNLASKNPICVPHLLKIDKGLREMNYFNDNPPEGKEHFKTMIHNDYWVNNTMLKFKDGEPISNKMVDFQVIEYASLARDVVFFLYSSVNVSILESHIDDLFKYYYDRFLEKLVSLQCDVSAYTFQGMMEEFALMARDSEFSHLLYMLPPIATLKGKAKDLSEIKEVDEIANEKTIHENYYKKMGFLLSDFARRKWI